MTKVVLCGVLAYVIVAVMAIRIGDGVIDVRARPRVTAIVVTADPFGTASTDAGFGADDARLGEVCEELAEDVPGDGTDRSTAHIGRAVECNPR
jgi:hypothetical protein